MKQVGFNHAPLTRKWADEGRRRGGKKKESKKNQWCKKTHESIHLVKYCWKRPWNRGKMWGRE